MNTKMESHQVLLESFNRTQNMELSTGISVFPQKKQQIFAQPESMQGTEPDITVLALTKSRIQQLENRRFLLREMLHFTEKSKDNSNRPTEEMTSEDCDKLSELEIIQKELEALKRKKEELQKQETGSKPEAPGHDTTAGQQETCPTFHVDETPHSKMDPPPPLQETKEEVKESQEKKVEPTAEVTRGPVIPVDRLRQTPDVTKCPSCQEVVFTETCRKVGEAAWITSCLCSMIGCVAGCCVLPFFMDRLKNVHHTCPHCHTHLHTFQPF